MRALLALPALHGPWPSAFWVVCHVFLLMPLFLCVWEGAWGVYVYVCVGMCWSAGVYLRCRHADETRWWRCGMEAAYFGKRLCAACRMPHHSAKHVAVTFDPCILPPLMWRIPGGDQLSLRLEWIAEACEPTRQALDRVSLAIRASLAIM